MRKLGLRLLKYFYVGLIAILPAYAIANNYQATSGSGTTFGSVVVSAVNYAQFMLCDLTTPATNCAAVDASGNVSVSLKAETTKVIGEVNQGTSPWVISGAVTNAGTFAVQLSGATNNINNIAGTITLPTGASTAAKQPALGTAGTPSTDVLSVQGITSMTPFKVDGSAVTQPTSAASGGFVDGAIATLGTKADAAGGTGSQTEISLLKQLHLDITGSSQYPAGATAITASATGTTAATTATLAGTSGKTTYMCWSSVRANATAATTVTDTITGVIAGTLSRLLWVAPAASGIGIDEMIYNPCIPASGTNTGIAIVSGAPGTGGAVTVNGGGYQL